MLRIRYLYAQKPAAPTLTRRVPTVTTAEAVNRHLERVGRNLMDFGVRRELLSASARLAEECCRPGR